MENPTGHPLDGLAIIDNAQARSIATNFPGTLTIAADTNQPTAFLPSQVVVFDDHGQPQELSIAVKLAPHEKKSLSIYYSTRLHEKLPSVPYVHASHSYGYNRATGAIESDLIGYRTYGGFFFDVQAHAQGQLGLFNSLIGYSSISNPPAAGQDVFHIGDTLGLGGLFLRLDDVVLRPPLNTPDYTHRVAKPDEPTYRVLADGPLRAIIEARLPHWAIGTDVVSLHALYEIRAGEEVVHCHWWIEPLHLSHTYEIGAGVRDLPQMRRLEAPGLLVISGTQDARVGPIAFGLSYNSRDAHRAGSLATPEGGNQIIVFAQRLAPGHAASGEYNFAAAWSGTGWHDAAAHLRDILERDQIQPVVRLVAHRSNPQPQRLESEPR